jgi:dolichol-phosphate mannosyltransferase
MSFLSIVIPTYNEKANLQVLLPRLADLLQGHTFEVLVVDDHSPDGTAAYVREVSRKDLRFRVI